MMKRVLATLTLLLAFSPLVGVAGEPEAKNPVQEVEPTDPEPFAPGLELSGFVSGAFPNSDIGDELGGGVGLAYFFTKNVGISSSYAVYAFEDTLHVISADLAVRYPVPNSGIAPYILMGGGLQADGDADGLIRLGGGLDLRLSELGNLGIFADGVYNWVEGDKDFTIARFGVRIPF